MEQRYMPGHFDAHTADKSSDPLQFFGGIVLPRDDQSRHLDPDLLLAHPPYGVQHRVEAARAHLSVAFIVEELKIHVRRIKIRRDKVERFRCHIPVRHEYIGQSPAFRSLCHVESVFHEYGRFSVGVGDAGTIARLCPGYDIAGRYAMPPDTQLFGLLRL
jgi:hypothetical protein